MFIAIHNPWTLRDACKRGRALAIPLAAMQRRIICALFSIGSVETLCVSGEQSMREGARDATGE